ncbi:CheR family methyltransferase [Hyalangium minutum]|uniref:Chemotaxis protein methyltransferase CheR n=1 Tax=Hyalangium minutum TaxID=394096 RepID=A0A085W9C6_9BACT|nr:CheR family methyltransferase [Hyalangium minutum]KFE64289.1 Chemotaxis protein methyltransferase CheR [Hyalangium minutum]
MTGGVDPLLYARARQLISERTGFRDDAIAPEALERLVRAEVGRGRSVSELFAELERPESEFSVAVLRASLVGETYFFRHPEHFRFIAREGVPRVLRAGAIRLRGWSAGCATGEEAYSLAACLLASAPSGLAIEVIGTDLNEASLAVARRATYGAWSRRDSAPHLFPLYRPLDEKQVIIFDSVRNVTTFMSGNLLSPLDAVLGQFHFILCRNVLTYFSPSARELAIQNLFRALAPGGYLFLGTVEVDRHPDGMVRVGPPELQAFHRPLHPELAPPPSYRPPSRSGLPAITPVPLPPGALSGHRPPSRTGLPVVTPAPVPPGAQLPSRPSSTGLPTVAPASPKPPESPTRAPSQLHLVALEHIEQGQMIQATLVLESLVKQYPDYLPGLLELALLRERSGSRSAAYPLMRAVHDRAAVLPPDQIVEGPESLPARFYKASADAYLNLGAAE